MADDDPVEDDDDSADDEPSADDLQSENNDLRAMLSHYAPEDLDINVALGSNFSRLGDFIPPVAETPDPEDKPDPAPTVKKKSRVYRPRQDAPKSKAVKLTPDEEYDKIVKELADWQAPIPN